jgi:hypothetical protein
MNSSNAPSRGNEILAVLWTLTTLSGVVLVLRIYCKMIRHRGMWWDDYVLVVAWVGSSLSVCPLQTSLYQYRQTDPPLRSFGPHHCPGHTGLRETILRYRSGERPRACAPRSVRGFSVYIGCTLE